MKNGGFSQNLIVILRENKIMAKNQCFDENFQKMALVSMQNFKISEFLVILSKF